MSEPTKPTDNSPIKGDPIAAKIKQDLVHTEQVISGEIQAEIVSVEHLRKNARDELKRLGPGLITGAADDDPSGLGTYAQTGARFGTGLLWLMPFMLPLMTAVQESVGRIGLVTGKGLASNIKKNYSKQWLYILVACLLFANIVNIGADIAAMADATKLLIDIPFAILAIAYVLLIVVLQIVVPYKRYAKVLKFLAISLVAYFISAIIAGRDWGYIAKSVIIPHWESSKEYVVMIAALLGTTISPYLFFWEPSQEVEEAEEHHQKPLAATTERHAKVKLRLFRKDNFVGMLLAQLTAMMVVITAYSTLHKAGVLQVEDAATAAKLLEPLVSGSAFTKEIVKIIFALGIVGTGLLAIPTLAGSAAYALSETLDIPEGLNRKFKDAKGFYIIITLACVGGLLFNLLGIPSFKALFYAAVVNAAMAVPLIVAIIKIGRDDTVMGIYKSRKLATTLCVITASVMFVSVIVSLVG